MFGMAPQARPCYVRWREGRRDSGTGSIRQSGRWEVTGTEGAPFAVEQACATLFKRCRCGGR